MINGELSAWGMKDTSSCQSAPGKCHNVTSETKKRHFCRCSFCQQTQLGDLLKGGFSEGWREFSGAASCGGCRVFIYCDETSSPHSQAPPITWLYCEKKSPRKMINWFLKCYSVWWQEYTVDGPSLKFPYGHLRVSSSLNLHVMRYVCTYTLMETVSHWVSREH